MKKGLLWVFGLLFMAVFIARISNPTDDREARKIAVAEPVKQPETPRKPRYDEPTRKKVAAIEDERFCQEYGKTLRAAKKSGDTPYSLAMTERAVNEFGAKAGFIDDIQERSLALGMGWCEVYAAIGKPDHGNRSVGSYGEHYQLVYRNRGRYVYLENGIVTSWQD